MDRYNRIGENNINRFGTNMIIVEYTDSMNIVVEFQDVFKMKKVTTYHKFKTGNVSNPYDRKVCGVGYIGQGKYGSGTKYNKDNCYSVWSRMIVRCYDPYVINRDAGLSYKDCTVCEEWHNFQNFAKWYEENYYEIPGEKMCLDKDLLVRGNNVYSPDTCVFIPERINILIKKQRCSKIGMLTGVYKSNRNKYAVRCSVSEGEKCISVRKFFGEYDTEGEAFLVYKKIKEREFKKIANHYKTNIPVNAYKSLYSFTVEYKIAERNNI